MRPTRGVRQLFLGIAKSSRSPATQEHAKHFRRPWWCEWRRFLLQLNRLQRRGLRRLRWPESGHRWKERLPNTRRQTIGLPLRSLRTIVCTMQTRRAHSRRSRAEIPERWRRSLLEDWLLVKHANRTGLRPGAGHRADRGKSSPAYRRMARDALRRSTAAGPTRGQWTRGMPPVRKAPRERELSSR